MSAEVGVLRELFRNYQAFVSLYESTGVDTITGPDGTEYSLWDLKYLSENLGFLPPRQRESIVLCLIQNIREQDAALMMGLSPTNPVAMYATDGLKNILKSIWAGDMPRFMTEIAYMEAV